MPNQRNSSEYTCQEVAEQATAFLEERLTAGTKANISLHLESCASCRTYVQQLALVRDSLHQLPGPEMPDQMRGTLARRLARITRDTDGSS